MEELVEKAADWIQAQRALRRPGGRPLYDEEQRSLLPFFRTDTLAVVRIVEMDDLTEIDDKVFAPYFPASGRPIELGKITGLTLVDTICLARWRVRDEAHRLAVLFQEIVHACQFERLGVHGFLRAYVHGWETSGRRHSDIPLERAAATLRSRFECERSTHFSVEQELLNE